jgi:hypothetical protein
MASYSRRSQSNILFFEGVFMTQFTDPLQSARKFTNLEIHCAAIRQYSINIQTWNYNCHNFESTRTHAVAITFRLERYSQANGDTRHVSYCVERLNTWNEFNGAFEWFSEWIHLLKRPFLSGTEFCETGCPSGAVNEDTVERVCQSFVKGSWKSTRRRHRRLNWPQKTVWKILWESFRMKRNNIQLARGVLPNVEVKWCTSCCHTANKIPAKTGLVNLVLSGEALFRLSGDVNKHSVMTGGTEQPRNTIQHVTDNAKANS